MVTGLIFYYWKVTNVLGKVSPILLDYTGCVFSDLWPFKAGSKYSQPGFLLAQLLSKFKLSSLTVRATTKRKYQWICAGDGLRPDRCVYYRIPGITVLECLRSLHHRMKPCMTKLHAKSRVTLAGSIQDVRPSLVKHGRERRWHLFLRATSMQSHGLSLLAEVELYIERSCKMKCVSRC